MTHSDSDVAWRGTDVMRFLVYWFLRSRWAVFCGEKRQKHRDRDRVGSSSRLLRVRVLFLGKEVS